MPNLLHQGGLTPHRAAEVLLANCAEAAQAGTLAEEILCLEPGMGMGMFAVQVLDRFQQRCEAQGVDWYQRLTWYATDATPKVLQDVEAAGIFARHAGRVVLGQATATDPARVRPLSGPPVDLTGRLQAVMHSYVFCMLPMNLFRVEGEQVSVMLARTRLRHPELLPQHTHLDAAAIQAIVTRGNPDEHLPLVDLHPLLDLELALSPVAPDSDGLERVRRIAGWIRAEKPTAGPVWVLDSHGAAHALQVTLRALRPDGFLLYRDYGPVTAEEADEERVYQHYGTTTAVQVSHFALERLVAGQARVTAPAGEEGLMKSRLVGAGALPATRAAFQRAYDHADVIALREATMQARQAPPAALPQRYDEAIAIEPDNWALLTEAAQARFARCADPAGAYALLQRSLAINPWYQATAWDLLGEMFLDVGRLDQARAALERARTINPEHARVYAALSRLHRQRGELEAAVICAAQAAAWDRSGEHTPALLATLDETIEALVRRRTRSQHLREERTAGGHHREFSF